MRTELEIYQRSPNTKTLGDFWLRCEPMARGVARDVAMKLGRAQDAWLLDAMVAESGYRIAKMASRLLTLRVESEAALAAYIKKIARGASYTAADDPIAGPSRRNAKRWTIPGEPLRRQSWPSEARHAATIYGTLMPGGARRSYSYTNLNQREAPSPEWTHAQDRGDAWHRLVTFVATAARLIATGNEKIAVEQVLAGESDAVTAAKLGIAKATWQDRRKVALRDLAGRIAAAADYEINEIGEKLLGDAWIAAANRAWAAVLHSREQYLEAA